MTCYRYENMHKKPFRLLMMPSESHEFFLNIDARQFTAAI